MSLCSLSLYLAWIQKGWLSDDAVKGDLLIDGVDAYDAYVVSLQQGDNIHYLLYL